MVQILAVDSKNDLYTVNNKLVIVTDLEAVLQGCAHAAKTRLGELVLATNEGVPYFQTIFNGTPNFQQFEAGLRNAFLQVTGVVEVVSLVLVKTNDTVTYTAVIRTIYGQGTVTNG